MELLSIIMTLQIPDSLYYLSYSLILTLLSQSNVYFCKGLPGAQPD